MNQGPSVLIWNRVLLAMDEKPISLDAVNYVAAVLGGSANCRVDLLAVVPDPNPDNFPNDQALASHTAELIDRLQGLLERGQRILTEAGMPAEVISTRLEHTEGRRVSDVILAVQAEGGYGTVVLGRRGLSKAEEFLMGSVSSAVMHQATNCCVWVVG